MTITPDALVVPFLYLSDVTRPMRVVVDHARGEATVEELRGTDALGAERWHLVDMDADQNSPGHPDCTAQEWAEMVACAIDKAYRERLPSGDAPPRTLDICDYEDCDQEPWCTLTDGTTRCRYHAADCALGGIDHDEQLILWANYDTHAFTREAKGGDAPQEPSDSDAKWLAWASRPSGAGGASIVDAIRERYNAGEPIASLALDFDISQRRIEQALGCAEASRPRGGAEPGLRKAVKRVEAELRHHEGSRVPAGYAANLVSDALTASEGAAPPQPTEDKTTSWGCEYTVNSETHRSTLRLPVEQPAEFHEGKPVEPAELDDLGRTIGEALRPGNDISVKVAGVECARPASGATVEVTREEPAELDHAAIVAKDTAAWDRVEASGKVESSGVPDAPGEVDQKSIEAAAAEVVHQWDLHKVHGYGVDKARRLVVSNLRSKLRCTPDAGLRAQLLDITPHVESLRDALSERRGHALMHESAKFICGLLQAALEVQS